ncbi:MAG: hypothetical protein ACTMUB_02860 [cyanobacterium endosymbiont of Rhopalodia musculus]|uniref:hypothetical protein n=1 Tax=cyanobacterium endosymbiont of Epithemia clementina EcSB TaxID=3034674 RepID=UPI00248130F8|nr:hypothetical protein [cyanobacterium endosymbiont of Epithemia clementina EcSB]WGT67159.1 hypothetical protein P3F56_08025 [cyanobacterium endosymbiont of Epithemia clementina EcSB]
MLFKSLIEVSHLHHKTPRQDQDEILHPWHKTSRNTVFNMESRVVASVSLYKS